MKVGRHELKYFITPQDCHRIKAWLEPHLTLDKWTRRGRSSYRIYSIYFDTQDLDFYFEKLDGVKVRKKLRIRGYNGDDTRDIYLEIKRKYGNLVVKERAPMKLRHVEPILDSGRPYDVIQSASFRDIQVIGKFIHTLKSRALRPTVLVIYDREALVGSDENRVRVTFDRDVSCIFRPELRRLFGCNDATRSIHPHIIMELKFNGPMPQWMRRMVWEFGLAARPISKYCSSIETCCRGDWKRAFDLLRSHTGKHHDL